VLNIYLCFFCRFYLTAIKHVTQASVKQRRSTDDNNATLLFQGIAIKQILQCIALVILITVHYHCWFCTSSSYVCVFTVLFPSLPAQPGSKCQSQAQGYGGHRSGNHFHARPKCTSFVVCCNSYRISNVHDESVIRIWCATGHRF